jgi:hypothetical protein
MTSRILKDWIRTETGKPDLSDEAILITKTTSGGIRIVLLDGQCCRPSVEIQKELKDITLEDIRKEKNKLQHQHA